MHTLGQWSHPKKEEAHAIFSPLLFSCPPHPPGCVGSVSTSDAAISTTRDQDSRTITHGEEENKATAAAVVSCEAEGGDDARGRHDLSPSRSFSSASRFTKRRRRGRIIPTVVMSRRRRCSDAALFPLPEGCRFMRGGGTVHSGERGPDSSSTGSLGEMTPPSSLRKKRQDGNWNGEGGGEEKEKMTIMRANDAEMSAVHASSKRENKSQHKKAKQETARGNHSKNGASFWKKWGEEKDSKGGEGAVVATAAGVPSFSSSYPSPLYAEALPKPLRRPHRPTIAIYADKNFLLSSDDESENDDTERREGEVNKNNEKEKEDPVGMIGKGEMEPPPPPPLRATITTKEEGVVGVGVGVAGTAGGSTSAEEVLRVGMIDPPTTTTSPFAPSTTSGTSPCYHDPTRSPSAKKGNSLIQTSSSSPSLPRRLDPVSIEEKGDEEENRKKKGGKEGIINNNNNNNHMMSTTKKKNKDVGAAGIVTESEGTMPSSFSTSSPSPASVASSSVPVLLSSSYPTHIAPIVPYGDQSLRRRIAEDVERSVENEQRLKKSMPQAKPGQSLSRVDIVRMGIQRLKLRLQDLKLVIVRVKNDGNCQFRAISHQLLGTEECHDIVRYHVVSYMKRVRKSQYDFYFSSTEAADAYFERLSRLGTWGDELTLRGASDSLFINIYVLSSQENNFVIVYRPRPDAPPAPAFLVDVVKTRECMRKNLQQEQHQQQRGRRGSSGHEDESTLPFSSPPPAQASLQQKQPYYYNTFYTTRNNNNDNGGSGGDESHVGKASSIVSPASRCTPPTTSTPTTSGLAVGVHEGEILGTASPATAALLSPSRALLPPSSGSPSSSNKKRNVQSNSKRNNNSGTAVPSLSPALGIASTNNTATTSLLPSPSLSPSSSASSFSSSGKKSIKKRIILHKSTTITTGSASTGSTNTTASPLNSCSVTAATTTSGGGDEPSPAPPPPPFPLPPQISSGGTSMRREKEGEGESEKKRNEEEEVEEDKSETEKKSEKEEGKKKNKEEDYIDASLLQQRLQAKLSKSTIQSVQPCFMRFGESVRAVVEWPPPPVFSSSAPGGTATSSFPWSSTALGEGGEEEGTGEASSHLLLQPRQRPPPAPAASSSSSLYPRRSLDAQLGSSLPKNIMEEEEDFASKSSLLALPRGEPGSSGEDTVPGSVATNAASPVGTSEAAGVRKPNEGDGAGRSFSPSFHPTPTSASLSTTPIIPILLPPSAPSAFTLPIGASFSNEGASPGVAKSVGVVAGASMFLSADSPLPPPSSSSSSALFCSSGVVTVDKKKLKKEKGFTMTAYSPGSGEAAVMLRSASTPTTSKNSHHTVNHNSLGCTPPGGIRACTNPEEVCEKPGEDCHDSIYIVRPRGAVGAGVEDRGMGGSWWEQPALRIPAPASHRFLHPMSSSLPILPLGEGGIGGGSCSQSSELASRQLEERSNHNNNNNNNNSQKTEVTRAAKMKMLIEKKKGRQMEGNRYGEEGNDDDPNDERGREQGAVQHPTRTRTMSKMSSTRDNYPNVYPLSCSAPVGSDTTTTTTSLLPPFSHATPLIPLQKNDTSPSRHHRTSGGDGGRGDESTMMMRSTSIPSPPHDAFPIFPHVEGMDVTLIASRSLDVGAGGSSIPPPHNLLPPPFSHSSLSSSSSSTLLRPDRRMKMKARQRNNSVSATTSPRRGGGGGEENKNNNNTDVEDDNDDEDEEERMKSWLEREEGGGRKQEQGGGNRALLFPFPNRQVMMGVGSGGTGTGGDSAATGALASSCPAYFSNSFGNSFFLSSSASSSSSSTTAAVAAPIPAPQFQFEAHSTPIDVFLSYLYPVHYNALVPDDGHHPNDPSQWFASSPSSKSGGGRTTTTTSRAGSSSTAMTREGNAPSSSSSTATGGYNHGDVDHNNASSSVPPQKTSRFAHGVDSSWQSSRGAASSLPVMGSSGGLPVSGGLGYFPIAGGKATRLSSSSSSALRTSQQRLLSESGGTNKKEPGRDGEGEEEEEEDVLHPSSPTFVMAPFLKPSSAPSMNSSFAFGGWGPTGEF